MVELPVETPDKQWMFVPALVLLGGIMLIQRRRREDTPATAAG